MIPEDSLEYASCLQEAFKSLEFLLLSKYSFLWTVWEVGQVD